jgi:hypothetical protein
MKRHHARPIDAITIGRPTVSGADGRYLLELAAVSDDTKRARLLRLAVGMDGNDLRALVTAVRAAGWSE